MKFMASSVDPILGCKFLFLEWIYLLSNLKLILCSLTFRFYTIFKCLFWACRMLQFKNDHIMSWKYNLRVDVTTELMFLALSSTITGGLTLTILVLTTHGWFCWTQICDVACGSERTQNSAQISPYKVGRVNTAKKTCIPSTREKQVYYCSIEVNKKKNHN